MKTQEQPVIVSTPSGVSASELEGYKAAAIVIEGMLDEAQAKRPKRQGNRKSEAYRAGYYDALLYAHCVLVWGEYPNHPSNLVQIRKIIQTPNDQAERLPAKKL